MRSFTNYAIYSLDFSLIDVYDAQQKLCEDYDFPRSQLQKLLASHNPLWREFYILPYQRHRISHSDLPKSERDFLLIAFPYLIEVVSPEEIPDLRTALGDYSHLSDEVLFEVSRGIQEKIGTQNFKLWINAIKMGINVNISPGNIQVANIARNLEEFHRLSKSLIETAKEFNSLLEKLNLKT